MYFAFQTAFYSRLKLSDSDHRVQIVHKGAGNAVLF